MKRKLARFAAVVVTGLSLSTGFAAAETGSLDTTGPNSTNRIRTNYSTTHRVNNDNNVRANVRNNQTARTGSANVHHNTTAGGATTGSVANDNWTTVAADVDNSSSAAVSAAVAPVSVEGGSIHLTGPNSTNTVDTNVRHDVRVRNTNNLTVNSSSNQSATTGSANVHHNTTGGSATTGDASNTSTSEVTLSITN